MGMRREIIGFILSVLVNFRRLNTERNFVFLIKKGLKGQPFFLFFLIINQNYHFCFLIIKLIFKYRIY